MPTYMFVFQSSYIFVLQNSGKLYQYYSPEVREDFEGSKREKQTSQNSFTTVIALVVVFSLWHPELPKFVFTEVWL